MKCWSPRSKMRDLGWSCRHPCDATRFTAHAKGAVTRAHLHLPPLASCLRGEVDLLCCAAHMVLGAGESQMRRRDFITLVGGAAVSAPLGARAQQRAMPVIGWLSSRSAATDALVLPAFRQALNAQ